MISAVVLTQNEEKNIERCLKSLSFCDEIIIVDDFSTDKTVELAKKFKAQVCSRKLQGNFSDQRTFGMDKARNKWVLFVDADEEVSEELREEIKNLNESFDAYSLRRRDFFWNKELKYGETAKSRNTGIVRLMKKGSGRWVNPVHEVYETSKSVGRLYGFLNHYPHSTVKEFITDINFYSTLRAKELLEKKHQPSIFEIILFPLGKFILTYFLKRGFLDGTAGFAYSFFMSFHSFLVRAKLYQYTYFHEKSSN